MRVSLFVTTILTQRRRDAEGFGLSLRGKIRTGWGSECAFLCASASLRQKSWRSGGEI